MKKIRDFLFLIIPFLFLCTSCVNILDEQYGQDISFNVSKEVADQITRDVSNTNSTSDNISITCLLLNNDMKQITSKTINTSLEQLNDTKIQLNKIPLGRDYKLVILISYNNYLIYSGSSTEPINVTTNAALKPAVSLAKVMSNITYELNGGTKGSGDYPKEYFLDSNITLPVPTYDGYDFAGWYTSSSFNGEAITTLGKDNFCGDVSLYAKWFDNLFTVNYETGTDEIIPSKTVGKSIRVEDIPIPKTTLAGKTFKGWYFNNYKVTEGFNVTENMTLTAVWGELGKVSNVIFSPMGDAELDCGDKILLSCDTPDSVIYYTINGGEKIHYNVSDPIIINEKNIKASDNTVTITAHAESTGLTPSDENSVSYKVKTYTVSFDQSNSNPIPNLYYGHVITVNDLPKPTKANDEFIGWTYKGSIVKEDIVVRGNMILQSLWKNSGAVQDVTYSLPSGSIDASSQITLTSTPGASIYYTLDGTNPKSSKSRILYSSPIKFKDGETELNISAYAEKKDLRPSNITSTFYTKKMYRVTIDTLGKGTKTPSLETIESKSFNKGDTLPTLESLSSDGYNFNGWIDNNGVTVTDSYIINDNVTISAIWKAIPYKINYNLDSNIVNGNPSSITIEDSFDLSKVSKKGYNFEGWYTTDTHTTKITKIEKGQKTPLNLYPKFTLKNYTITYFDAPDLTTDTYNIETPKTLPIPVKNGYVFIGWFLDANRKQSITSLDGSITGDLSLYAKWTDGNTVSDVVFVPSSPYLDINEKITLSCATPGATIYYTLDGTVLPSSKIEYNPSTPITMNGDRVVINAWAVKDGLKDSSVTNNTYIMKTYTVSFDSNGHGSAPKVITGLKKGDVIPSDKLTALNANGYTFNGWLDSNGKVVDSSYQVMDNQVVIAQWTLNGNVPSVKFSPLQGSYDVNQEITLTCLDPKATIYYTTDGSDPKTSSSAKIYTSSFVLSENTPSFNILAYAKKDTLISSSVTSSSYNLKRYDVRFITEHGVAPQDQLGLLKGTVITLTDMSENGYTFTGWSDGATSPVKNSYTVNNNVTLSAVWQRDNYQVTYGNCESPVINSNPKYVTIEDSFTLSDPYKEGYIFGGWFTDPQFTENSKQTAINKTTGPIALYANFTPRSYNITYSLNGGAISSSETAPSTYDITKEVILPVPTRDKYTFGGWFTDKEVTSGLLKDNKIAVGTNGDLTLYAKWTENGKVSDVVITGPENGMVDANFTQISLSCDTPSAQIYYTLDGLEPTTSSTPYAAPFTISQDTTVKAFAFHSELKKSNITVKSYKLNKYKVIFIDNYCVLQTQTLQKGEKVTEPNRADIEYPGYKFGGWIKGKNPETGENIMWDFVNDTVPNKDITLTALMTPINYQVNFDATSIGGTVNTKTYNYEEEFVIPSFNLDGPGYSIFWNFPDAVEPNKNIYHVGDIASGLCNTENGVVTLTAEKNPIIYQLSYNINTNELTEVAAPPSGEFGPKSIPYSDTETITLPSYSLYYQKNLPGQSYKPLKKWQSSDGRIFNEGEVIKNNLLTTNGGKIILTPMWTKELRPVTSVTATAQDKDIVLSWFNPNEPDIKQVNITSEPPLNIGSVKVTPNERSTVTISNVKYGQKYTFTLNLEDKNGNTVPDTNHAFCIPMRPLTSTPRILNKSEYRTPYEMEGNWEYIAFGDWPQSEKEPDVTLSEETTTINGWTVQYGSDGYYYTTVKATPHSSITEITSGNNYVIKLEPIVWRVLIDTFNGNKLLFAEKALAATYYYKDESTRNTNIYPSNYEKSNVRAYLNGLDGTAYNVDNYTNNGFINKAFTKEAQDLICVTDVDNSPSSTYSAVETIGNDTNGASCSNTKDKVFLLSKKEVSNTAYGFTYDTAKTTFDEIPSLQKELTFYAKVTGASRGDPAYQLYKDYTKYSYYWTRSPSNVRGVENRVLRIYSTGTFAPGSRSGKNHSETDPVTGNDKGIVPAIAIRGGRVDITPPSEVRNLTATPNEDRTGIILAWDNPTDSDFHTVTISYTDEKGASEEVLGINPKETTHTVTGLTKGTLYTFTIKTKDTSSNVSNGITIKGSIPNEVTNIDFSSTENSIKLTWTNPNDAAFTKVNITCDTKTINPIVGNPGQEGTYTITGLDKTTAYNISISTEYTDGFKSKGHLINLKPLQGIKLQGEPLNVTDAAQLPQIYEFGVYPQTIKDDAVLISKATTSILNWTCKYGSDGNYYVEGTPEANCLGKKFSNGTPMESGKTYYFKLEPITWKFSGYTTPEGGAMYYTEKLVYNSQWGDASTHTDYRKSLVNINLNSEFANNICSKEMLNYLYKDSTLASILDKPEYFWLMDNRDYGDTGRGFSSDSDRDAPSTDYAFLKDTNNDGTTVNDVVQGTRDGNVSGVGMISNTGAVSSTLNAPIAQVYPFRVATFFKMKTAPTIKPIVVPRVGKTTNGKADGPSTAGTKMTCYIHGTNFKLCEPPTATGTTTNATVKVLTDELMELSLTIPDIGANPSGTYKFRVSIGSINALGMLSVTDYSQKTNLVPGICVTTNSEYLPLDQITSMNRHEVCGIFYGCYSKYGAPLIVSIYDSYDNKKAGVLGGIQSSYGYKTKYDANVCTSSSSEIGTADTVTIEGDLYGYDNWYEILKVYGNDQNNLPEVLASKELPTFKYANEEYGAINLPDSSYGKGWYVPSLKELCDLYKADKTLNLDNIIKEVSRVGLTQSSCTIKRIYWSSSQSPNHADANWVVDFSNGQPLELFRSYDKNVRCISEL